MSVLDYVEPLPIKEGKELQDFEREIFGGRAQNKDADSNVRLKQLIAENDSLKFHLARFGENLPFLPKTFPDFPDYFFRVSPVDHPIIYAQSVARNELARISDANFASANTWKVKADEFEKANLNWVAHGKSQDMRISELVARVNDLNAANATFVKANSALKKQVLFSSLMVFASLLPHISKLFA